MQGVQEGEEQTEIMQEQTELTLSELCRMEPPTPIHSPASTPAATPVGTPVQSPQRVIQVKRPEQQSTRVKDMKPPPGPQRKKEKKEEEREVDAGIVLFTYRGSRLPGHKLDHIAKVGLLKRSQILKYIYRNKSLDRGAVWNMVLQKRINLTDNVIYEVEREQYDRVSKGSYLDLKVDQIELNFRQL